MNEINIPILGDDDIYSLYQAFILELHEKGFIHVPNHTSSLAILDCWIASVREQVPHNFTIIKKDVDSKSPKPKLKMKEEITEHIPLIPRDLTLNAKIIHATEKAYIVQRTDGLVAVIAKSHLAKKYSKNDVRQNLVFKTDRRWALDKLKWEENKFE